MADPVPSPRQSAVAAACSAIALGSWSWFSRYYRQKGWTGIGCFTVASDSSRRGRFYGVIAMSSIILSEIPHFGRQSNRQRKTRTMACARTPWHSHFNSREEILRPRPCPGGPRPHTFTCPPLTFFQQQRVFFSLSAALLRCLDGEPRGLRNLWMPRSFLSPAMLIRPQVSHSVPDARARCCLPGLSVFVCVVCGSVFLSLRSALQGSSSGARLPATLGRYPPPPPHAARFTPNPRTALHQRISTSIAGCAAPLGANQRRTLDFL